VLNLSNTVAKAEISLPEVLKGRYTNYFIDEPLELTDSLNIELGAWDYKVMVK
jgi:hypothetical protein